MAEMKREIAMEAAVVTRVFPVKGPDKVFTAVDAVNLRLYSNETLALVGESGSGKTTLSRIMLGLLPPTTGDVQIFGRDISTYGRLERARMVQPVFQDPYASLNPRKRIADVIAMPLLAAGPVPKEDVRDKVLDLLQKVDLPAAFAERFPHELSGGQRQRVAIARALINRPRILVCDEPTSALDVSVQAQILQLLKDLKAQFGLSYLIVTHNIGVVTELADRVAVMYRGGIVEEGRVDDVLSDPRADYTRQLLSAVLPVDPDLARLPTVPLMPLSSTQTF